VAVKSDAVFRYPAAAKGAAWTPADHQTTDALLW